MALHKWPKIFKPLTLEQQWISHDFMKHWHETLPKKYGMIDRFNQSYSVRNAPAKFRRTLEIGAGVGEHIDYEKLTPEQAAEYYALELRENMSAVIRERHPHVQTVTGDCQERLPHPDGYFDRILAIHVLEHLPNLPAAVIEAYRLCDRARGVLSVVIPCEGGLAYSLARRVSAQRIFEKRYGQPYKWFIEREHVNQPHEILAELYPYFTITHRRFFPFRFIPATWCNLVIGLTLKPRERPFVALGESLAA